MSSEMLGSDSLDSRQIFEEEMIRGAEDRVRKVVTPLRLIMIASTAWNVE